MNRGKYLERCIKQVYYNAKGEGWGICRSTVCFFLSLVRLQADGRGQRVDQVGGNQRSQETRLVSGGLDGDGSHGLLLLLGQGQTLELVIKLLEDVNVADKGLARLLNDGLVGLLIDLDLVQADTVHVLEGCGILDLVKVVEGNTLTLGQVVVLLELLGQDLSSREISEVTDIGMSNQKLGLGLGATLNGVNVGLLGRGNGGEHVAPLGAIEELEVLLETLLARELLGEVDELNIGVVLVLVHGLLEGTKTERKKRG